jgi:hypothetical protein
MLMHLDPNRVGCSDLDQFLYEYSERELDPRVLMAFDQHLLGCQHCRRTLESYRASNETVKKHLTRDIRLPREFKDSLLRTLRGQPA